MVCQALVNKDGDIEMQCVDLKTVARQLVNSYQPHPCEEDRL